MLALIADPSPFNRRFLRIAATREGFDDVRDVPDFATLMLWVEELQPQLVLVDPSIHEGSPIDVLDPLAAKFMAASVVLSNREAVLTIAGALGFVTAVKRSVTDLDRIQAAIAKVRRAAAGASRTTLTVENDTALVAAESVAATEPVADDRFAFCSLFSAGPSPPLLAVCAGPELPALSLCP